MDVETDMECDCEEEKKPCEGIRPAMVQRQREKISKVIETKIEPLFSFPPELMECIKCKRKDDTRERWRQEETYTKKRLRVEGFRRFITGLIVKTELAEVNLDLDNDQDVNRYYNYICNGVDTVHTVQMPENVVEMILNLVPYALRDRFTYHTESLLIEIRETFTTNIKKAILAYALQDCTDSSTVEHEKTTMIVMKIKASLPGLPAMCKKNRAFLRDNLYLINPCMKMTLELWTSQFGDFRLIDVEKILEFDDSWDLMEFHKTVYRQIFKARHVLKKQWYAGIQDIFLVNNRKGLVPSPVQRVQFKRFYECLGKIMETQLLFMCKTTLKDFMNSIVRARPINCEFNVDVVVGSNELVFDPSFEKFKEVLASILHEICEAVRHFDMLETQLYLDWSGPDRILQPHIEEPRVRKLEQEIIDLIDREKLIPERILADLQIHEHLYGDLEFEKVGRFIKDESKTLEEYNEMIKHYHDLLLSFPIEVEKTAFTGLFKVSRKRFVDAVIDNVYHIKCLLTDTLVERYQTIAKSVADEYQAISERALNVPTNTAELMDLKSFVRSTIEVTLKKLEQSLYEIVEHILLLSDYYLLTDLEINTTNEAFQWFHKVPEILEQNESIVGQKTLEFQQALRIRYIRFEEELESYAKQVEEIQYWGDIAEVYKYQKRAQNLENRLIAAMEKIDKFNEEEAAFGWELTQYPRRKQIADQLKPSKQLFDAICDFLTKRDKWLNSMIGSYNPEDIENDVGYAFRFFYTLQECRKK